MTGFGNGVEAVLGYIDWPSVLVGLSALLLLLAGFIIFKTTARAGGPKWNTIVREYRAIIACFFVLLIATIMIMVASYLSTPAGETFRPALLQGIAASLIEDLAVFSLLGFIIILIQRREADQNRNLDDKIELLFSAKKLRSGEVAYLREELRKISSDCREAVIEIDVIDYDEDNGLIRIDVGRRYYVANYLSTDSAQYRLKIDITPDDACGHEPCLQMFPTITNTVVRSRGEWRRSADDEVLDQGAELNSGQPYRPPEKRLEIAPGQVREFRTRFRGWQRLYKKETGPGGLPESDAYRLLLLKHWDEIQINVRNSLTRKLRVTISGRESRSFELVAGDEQQKAYRVENLSPNSTVHISFMPG